MDVGGSMDPYAHLDGDQDEIMMKACREGDAQKVTAMLADGYDYNKWKAEDGKYQFFSPMNMAVKRGHIEIVQLFMEEGVHVEIGEMEATPEGPPTVEAPSEQITQEEFQEMAEKMAADMVAEEGAPHETPDSSPL